MALSINSENKRADKLWKILILLIFNTPQQQQQQ